LYLPPRFDPFEFLIELTTHEGRRNLAHFLLLLLTGAMVLIAAAWIVTGHGLTLNWDS